MRSRYSARAMDSPTPTKDRAGGSNDDSRRRQMTAVASLVRAVAPSHGVDWLGLVGSLLGGLTVPLGVNDARALRVMAVNDTARRELEARADALLEVWNAAAEARGERTALTMQCWVHEGLVTPGQRPTLVKKPGVTVSPATRERAAALTESVVDSGVREALTEMRAKALELGAMKDKGER